MRGRYAVLLLILACSAYSRAQSNSTAAQASPAGALTLSATAAWVSVSDRIPPLALPDGRLIVTSGDTIFMVGRDGKVSWRYSGAYPVNAQPAFRSNRNEIAVIGSDLGIVRLNADTGNVISKTSPNDSAQFTDLKTYADGYLVLVDMTGERFATPTTGGESANSDALRYLGKMESDGWQVPFPTGFHLLVAGDRIYAVKYQGSTVTLLSIQPGSSKK